jgi:membrane glycosyltransferase
MTPAPWFGFWRGLALGLFGPLLGSRYQRTGAGGSRPEWQRAAERRRLALLALVAMSAGGALWALGPMPDDPGVGAYVERTLFALLFAWVSAGCFTAVMGFVVMLRGDRHGLYAARLPRTPLPVDARTALLMPICNEDVATVFGGLRATCESLHATGQSHAFDVFVLSDTRDPALQAAELRAVAALRDAMAALGDAAPQVHYRHRRLRTKRKAGNVADWCRRWGRAYRYMVVMDADSVMTGDSLVTLVRAMESRPTAGILQTAPQPCGTDTLHARAQAFVSRVTGRLFTAGLAYWQLGESHYWGHNAILRVAPFMQHCALAKLPGRGGLAGEILSHDFVEAALIRRAGYEVWLVPDIDGSYEQLPPNLADELQRDRRWCQGNLQNARLIAEPGFARVHRTMFLTGALSYLASPLWLGFVLLGLAGLGGAAVADDTLRVGPAGAPWILWALTLGLLVLPRLLGLLTVIGRREAARFGGVGALARGALFELGLSALQAPVRMVAHSLFVLGALTGLKLEWKSPPRDAAALGWRDAFSRFGLPTLAVVGAAAAASQLGRGDPLQALPLAVPLLLAVPLAVWSSRAAVGQELRRQGLLLVPEESAPALPLQHARHYAALPWAEGSAAMMLARSRLPLASAAGRSALAASHRLANVARRSPVWARALVACAVVLAPTQLLTPQLFVVPGVPPIANADAWRQLQLERFERLQAESTTSPRLQRASYGNAREAAAGPARSAGRGTKATAARRDNPLRT